MKLRAAYRKLPSAILILLALTALIGISIAEPGGLTLKQAVSLSFSKATSWSREARLTYAISTEAVNDIATSQGKTGRWSNWNVIFVEENTGRNLLVAVRNGQVAYTKEILTAFKNPIKSTDLKLDSTSAVNVVRTMHRDSQPTKIHFELLNQQSPLLRVYCQCCNGLCIIGIDENTGKIISQWKSTVD